MFFVTTEITALRKCGWTLITFEWLLASVRSYVSLEVGVVSKGLPTDFTGVWLLSSVGS